MAAEKKGSTIVIKKIFVQAGHHGGSWKVALADFMTALMCFFLVMWLLNQTPETKKNVSDYFSTPSIIEYNFSNFGVELTLEKLFLDLVNEPLKAFQSFMEPVDRTPNLMDMGSAKVVSAFLADQLQDLANGVSVQPDGFEFIIIDSHLFEPGTATPKAEFVEVMDKLKAVTTGLEDTNITISSLLFNESVSGSSHDLAEKVAAERLDLVKNKVSAGLEHATNAVFGATNVTEKQKEVKADGSKPRKLDTLFGSKNSDMSEYDNFVKQISEQKKKPASINK
jgi:chemotaxis protein MotB